MAHPPIENTRYLGPDELKARPSEFLINHLDELHKLFAKYEKKGFRNFRVFGSVARGDDDSESDIDILVDSEPTAHITYMTLAGLVWELEGVLGCKVDLSMSEDLRDEIKERILNEAKIL